MLDSSNAYAPIDTICDGMDMLVIFTFAKA